MKTQWRKMESWRPDTTRIGSLYTVYTVMRLDANGEEEYLLTKTGKTLTRNERRLALRAANAANRLYGLPEVT